MLIFACLVRMLAVTLAGAVVGLLLGAFTAGLVGFADPEPERFTRPCLIVGAAVGALSGFAWFVLAVLLQVV